MQEIELDTPRKSIEAQRINKELVEAAGVEPVISTENTQVTDTKNA